MTRKKVDRGTIGVIVDDVASAGYFKKGNIVVLIRDDLSTMPFLVSSIDGYVTNIWLVEDDIQWCDGYSKERFNL